MLSIQEPLKMGVEKKTSFRKALLCIMDITKIDRLLKYQVQKVLIGTMRVDSYFVKCLLKITSCQDEEKSHLIPHALNTDKDLKY